MLGSTPLPRTVLKVEEEKEGKRGDEAQLAVILAFGGSTTEGDEIVT